MGLYEVLPDSCKAEPYWVEDRGHNDIGETLQCRGEYLKRLRDYLGTLDDNTA
jgi:hypothetical protein